MDDLTGAGLRPASADNTHATTGGQGAHSAARTCQRQRTTLWMPFLAFADASLEASFGRWYYGVHLQRMDFWGTLVDVLLHIVTVSQTRADPKFWSRFAISFPIALVHFYVLCCRRPLHVRWRREIILVRRLVVGALVTSIFPTTAAPAVGALSGLRNLLGATGMASVAVLQLQFMETTKLTLAYNIITMLLFLRRTDARLICADSRQDRASTLVAAALQGLRLLSASLLGVVYEPRKLGAGGGVVVDAFALECRTMIRTLQVMNAFAATLMIYALEWRARVNFLKLGYESGAPFAPSTSTSSSPASEPPAVSEAVWLALAMRDFRLDVTEIIVGFWMFLALLWLVCGWYYLGHTHQLVLSV